MLYRLRILLLAAILIVGLAACPADEERVDPPEDTSTEEELDGTTRTQPQEHPVELSGVVNDHGEVDLGGEETTQLDVSADDNYFDPTFIHTDPGATVTVTVSNDGEATHTFTLEELGVDVELAPGDSEEVEVQVPDEDGAWRFHCRFHAAAGMQGAFFTAPGQDVGDS